MTDESLKLCRAPTTARPGEWKLVSAVLLSFGNEKEVEGNSAIGGDEIYQLPILSTSVWSGGFKEKGPCGKPSERLIFSRI